MQDLARMSLVKSANKNSVDYNDLANIVDQQETLQFLQGKFVSALVINRMLLLYPSVLGHCRLSKRKGIWLVKIVPQFQVNFWPEVY